MSKEEKSLKISDLKDNILLDYYEDEVKDQHYHPYGDKLNQSGFKYNELRDEILSRMSPEL